MIIANTQHKPTGKFIKIEIADYKQGDQNILRVMVKQGNGWVVILDHDMRENV
ncbi:hypothetical protein M0R72_15270 [Candidatus Pacearchaeota archaeon]|jgi:hypothetical protein|nr:hypothetical protein [Candidatus Pacearchaeota archaeon]